MKKLSFISIVILTNLLFSSQVSIGQYRKSANRIKSELRQSEQSAPLEYINVLDWQWSVNLASNTVIKGRLQNTASMAGFKNITLRATFKTKTGSYVSDETWTVLEFLGPGGVVDFRRTISGWWGDAKSCSIEVVSAESY